MSEEEDGNKMRVRLLRDIIVNATPGKVGEEYDVPVAEARYLVHCGAVERVEEEAK